MAALTDEQIAAEEEFMRGLPRFNLAAFLIAPIWGPAHGFWITILFYPAWVLFDNVVYTAVFEPSALSIIVAILSLALIIGVSVIFSLTAQPIAAHRAEDKGISRERYLKRQRIWAVASVVIAIIMITLATWYNIAYRPFS